MSTLTDVGPVAATRTPKGAPRRPPKPRGGLLLGLLAWLIGFLFVLPVLWMVLTSLHSEEAAATNPPSLAAPLVSVEVALIWQWTPFMMLILLAGLQSRPLDVIEAARIDGASGWQIFRYMTFPHLRQYLELGGLLGAIYIVQNFDAVFTITSGGLGTANLPYTIYQTFYQAHDYGRASAAGVVVVIGTILIATLALRTVSTLFREENAR